jgi:ABC-2 type transport system ATP-binding protein
MTGIPSSPAPAPLSAPPRGSAAVVPAVPEAVCVERLALRFGARMALDNLDLAVAAGERFALLGPNGSGKSTLLRVLATLLRPSAGHARVDGLDVRGRSGDVRRRLGVVFQAPTLDGKLTVAENLRFQGHLYGLSGRALAARSDDLLARFGLGERRRDRAETLSGGLRRRVELAKALLHRPSVLLLDEPTSGLDLASRRAFWETLDALHGEGGLTVMVATHLMDEAERCGRVALLDEGRLVALDTPAALKGELGEAVLTLESADPPALARGLAERLGLHGIVQDGVVRVPGAVDAALGPRLLAQFPDEVSGFRLGRPTLGDVFLARTGHTMTAQSAPPTLSTAQPHAAPEAS